MPNSLSLDLSQSRSKPSTTRGSPKKEGENGVIDHFLEYDNLKIVDTFSTLSTLAGVAIVLLSWDIN